MTEKPDETAQESALSAFVEPRNTLTEDDLPGPCKEAVDAVKAELEEESEGETTQVKPGIKARILEIYNRTNDWEKTYQEFLRQAVAALKSEPAKADKSANSKAKGSPGAKKKAAKKKETPRRRSLSSRRTGSQVVHECPL